MSDIIKKMKALVLKEVAIYNQMIIDKQNENEVAEFFEIEDLNKFAEEFFNSEKSTKKSVVKKEKKALDETEKCSATTSSGKECSKKRTTKEEFVGTEFETLCLTHINTLKNGKTKKSSEETEEVSEIDEAKDVTEVTEVTEVTTTERGLTKEAGPQVITKPKRSKKVKSEEIIEEENL